MDSIPRRYLYRSAELENEMSNLVEIDYGRGYGEEPSSKDEGYIDEGLNAFGGEYHSATDKTVTFEFPSAADAKRFAAHVKTHCTTCFVEA